MRVTKNFYVHYSFKLYSGIYYGLLNVFGCKITFLDRNKRYNYTFSQQCIFYSSLVAIIQAIL